VTAIVGWLYEPGMPLALPVMYDDDDPPEGVIVQVVSTHSERLALLDEVEGYKQGLCRYSKGGDAQ
jgi:hypothetical protein